MYCTVPLIPLKGRLICFRDDDDDDDDDDDGWMLCLLQSLVVTLHETVCLFCCRR